MSLPSLTVSTIRLLYVFDPLCGWCYASAPALAQLACTYSGQLEMWPSGLFSEAGARDLTPEWAGYAWSNDQRIAAITAQVFSKAYQRDVLQGPSKRFDSTMLNRGLTLVRSLEPSLEHQLLARSQLARYVDGQDTVLASVVARLAVQVLAQAGLAADVFSFTQTLESDATLLQQTLERVQSTQALMDRLSVRGVPQLLLLQGEQVRMVDSSALYRRDNALLEQVAELGQALLSPPTALARSMA